MNEYTSLTEIRSGVTMLLAAFWQSRFPLIPSRALKNIVRGKNTHIYKRHSGVLQRKDARHRKLLSGSSVKIKDFDAFGGSVL